MGQNQSHTGNMKGQKYAFQLKMSHKMNFFCFKLTCRELMPYPWHCPSTVHDVPRLCLLGIGGAPYISHKINIFTFSTSSLRSPAHSTSYYVRRFDKSRAL